MSNKINLKNSIATIPDFPKSGILFYDISPMLANGEVWHETIRLLSEKVKAMKPDIIVGLESRGFLVSSAVAIMLNMGFVMVRKKGKLPGKVISHSYDLEYGSDILEIQDNAIKKGQRVVILDDLLATGGTINAAVDLLHKIGANPIAALCILELLELKGREKVKIPTDTLLSF